MPRAGELARTALRPLYRRAERAVRRHFPTQLDNLEWNRKMADGYARHAGRGGTEPIGQEWGATPAEVDEILDRFLFPHLTAASTVVEIGVGGGRIAARVAPRVRRLVAFDISPEMLDAARRAVGHLDNVELHRLTQPVLPAALTGEVDLVYAFATFLHLDLHMMRRYFEEMARILKPGGHAFVHTATITTPGGWARFEAQESYSVLGFYFVSPEIVETLARHAGFTLVQASQPLDTNAYLNRDYFAVFRR